MVVIMFRKRKTNHSLSLYLFRHFPLEFEASLNLLTVNSSEKVTWSAYILYGFVSMAPKWFWRRQTKQFELVLDSYPGWNSKRI